MTKKPYHSEIVVSPEGPSFPAVDKMSHLRVLRSLEECYQEGAECEDKMFYVKVKDYKKEAIDYSVKHQVLSQYTSFLCIGKELIDGQFQEYVDKGVEDVTVPKIESEDKKEKKENS